MRAAVFVILTAALLGLLMFVNRNPGGDLGNPDTSGDPDPQPIDVQPEAPDATGPDRVEPLKNEGDDPPPGDVRSEAEPDAMVGPMRSFHGTALIQFEGQLIRQSAGGTLEIDVIGGGARTRIEGVVAAGHFDIEVPVNGRLILCGGELDGHEVNFEKPKGPFDPTDDDYALVGLVVPKFRIIARDGITGAPLRSASVYRAEDASSAWLEGGDFAGEEVITDEPSPITLPFIETNRPVWLRITAPEYAGTHVLVDPREDGEREVRLWPSANLTVRVTGPGRNRLRVLTAARLDPGGDKLHAATFSMTHPQIQRGPDSITFPIHGLAGVGHVLVARGVNPKSQVVALGQMEITLGPRDDKTVEFRLE